MLYCSAIIHRYEKIIVTPAPSQGVATEDRGELFYNNKNRFRLYIFNSLELEELIAAGMGSIRGSQIIFMVHLHSQKITCMVMEQPCGKKDIPTSTLN